MNPPDDAPTIDPDRTFDPLTSAPTFVAATPTPTPATARVASGAIVGGRYRLVSLLGRGGMGEVYRADDLTLDQPVALKFLPEGVAVSDVLLAQFHNELRVARQVSHKNVCRLYDLGDADGRRFLTMEYVDGEDLSTSLRRFGRMPPDKAVQIARQLCAGVAAAHERGVLHRDLKPANVMLDGNGDVRITDFGIATAAADGGADIAGTPQYMAPELLAGKPASIKSDLYALGLILFEVFTGKRVFDGKTIAELRRQHDTATLTTPSAMVRDLDPAIERVILRCLEKDPEKRPASALTIAASLPGSDALAAALAAGETPSPELLVAAGESEAMPVRRALALAVACTALVLGALGPITRGSAANVASMPLARDVLADRAEQVLRKAGYAEPIGDRALGLGINRDYLRWAERTGPNNWWDGVRTGRPSPITFWYRTSPKELVAVDTFKGRVEPDDPSMNLPGMQQVTLDGNGRVTELRAVPPETATTAAEATAPAAAPPWETLFDAAGLDHRSFTATTPTWIPRDFSDATAAWEGPMPGRTDQRIRVEAAAYKGRLTWFRIIWPWTEPQRTQVEPKSGAQKAAAAMNILLFVLLLGGGVALGRRNLRQRRADSRGAARFGIVMSLAYLGARLAGATHSTEPGDELSQIFGALAFAAFNGGICWVYYLAVEPYGRRFWPDALLGWTRLWSGRLRDPRVGRELLIGMTFGALSLLVVEVPKLLASSLGWKMPMFPFGNALWVAASTPGLVSQWLGYMTGGLSNALAIAMIFLVLRLLLRRPRLALVVGVIVLMLALNAGQVLTGNWVERFNAVAFTALITFVIHRYGLVAAAALLFVDNIVADTPLTTDLSVWWSTPTVLTLPLVLGLVAFAYYAARGGEPLFGQVVPD
ncbi:MAG TPA: serine/threonine-protein kinase [Vicinamibacterales bacterium]|jgi:serine/threonine-protein kinase|nr:serine/threonine-protein kinase [Vicinamibacterales bacterium]